MDMRMRCILSFLIAAPGLGQPLAIVRIADTSTIIPGTTTPFALFNYPSAGDGVVGFSGTSSVILNPGMPAGVYRGSGGGLSIIADITTPIPGGIGNFTQFAPAERYGPSLFGSDTAFIGDGAGTSAIQRGIYLRTAAGIQRIVDRSTVIPNGGGATFGAIGPPSLQDGSIAFVGRHELGGIPTGLFAWRAASLIMIADITTRIPGRPAQFTGVGDCDLENGAIAFTGLGPAGYRGIFRAEASGVITRLYDTDMMVPGGNGGVFTSLGRASMDDGHVAFFGTGGDQNGIYTDLPGALTFAAHLGTPIPGRPGLIFSSFGRVDLSGDIVAFIADDGAYFWQSGTLHAVLNPGDLLDGRIVDLVNMSKDGFEGSTFALHVEFTNGTQGIYMATIPGPGVVVSLAAAGLLFTRRRCRVNVGPRGLR
ncbi:MAG: hypothetical protein IT437_11525 [Phycisphaerales bacterium]|nr:hypothetical protein [Phycisphaerales bacterium]